MLVQIIVLRLLFGSCHDPDMFNEEFDHCPLATPLFSDPKKVLPVDAVPAVNVPLFSTVPFIYLHNLSRSLDYP